MRTRLALLAAAFGLLAAAVPAIAHHAFAAEYDGTKPVKVKGVVTKVEWMNPHIWFYLDVKDDSGKVTTWGFSGGPPGMLARRGINKDVLKTGDVILVEGFRAKDGTNTCNSRSVKLPSGKSVFAGSADDGGPSKGGTQQ